MNINLIKVLDMYKSGSINGQEAEKMINSLYRNSSNVEDSRGHGCSGHRDKVIIAAYRGDKLIGENELTNIPFEVDLKGDVLNVECRGSLKCGDVRGNASAGSNIRCGNIGGNVSAGSNITCEDIGGNVSAGSSVHCKNISKRASGGGGIHIDK